MASKTVLTALYAVALAMGVSSAIMAILAAMSLISALDYTVVGVLLGIAVFCLAVAGLDSLESS